ncbi:MAG: enoyl-CoA hydratase [Deltaproteobacteria bacterium]|nr:enoyl-CoA hydratase [Deltaproteobacteria bacterium]
MSDAPPPTSAREGAERLVLSALEGRVLTVTLNRPERKNALTLAMYDALTAALRGAAEDPAVRAVVLRGAGGCFTSGNDLQDFMRSPPKSHDTPVFHFLAALLEFPKPLIAAVEGPAVGIGTTLLLHCDLAFAAEGASFQLPFGRLGLVPEGGSSYLLPLMVGHRRAAELLLLGERFGADDAARLGVINAAWPAEGFAARVAERAAAVAALPPEATRLSKQLLKAPFRDELARVMRAEGEVFIGRLGSPENAEAFMAFAQKRAPDFSRF